MLKLFVYGVFILGLAFSVNAQNADDSVKTLKAVAPHFYPAAAEAVRAQGEVKIRVKIDEKGEVESAKVLSGHPLLRKISENAALRWKFNPDEKEKARFVELSFIYKIVSDIKDEEISFPEPFTIVFAIKPREILDTPSH